MEKIKAHRKYQIVCRLSESDYVIGILRTRLHANRHTRHEGRRPPLARRQLGMRRIWNRLLLLLLFGQSPTLAHSLSTQIHFHCDLIVLSCKSEKVLRRRLCCCRMSVTCLFIGHAHLHRSRCVCQSCPIRRNMDPNNNPNGK